MVFRKIVFPQKPLHIVIIKKILTLSSGWSSIILLKSSVFFINFIVKTQNIYIQQLVA